MTKKDLKQKAVNQYLLAFMVVLVGLSISLLLGGAAFLMLIFSVIIANMVIYIGVTYVRCENCGEPYGLTVNRFASIIIPDTCACCGAQAE